MPATAGDFLVGGLLAEFVRIKIGEAVLLERERAARVCDPTDADPPQFAAALRRRAALIRKPPQVRRRGRPRKSGFPPD